MTSDLIFQTHDDDEEDDYEMIGEWSTILISQRKFR